MNNKIRELILEMMHYSNSSHIGSCLSIVDILYVLYFKIMNVDSKDVNKINRDKFILSKGHGSAALYATLAEKGFFEKEYLKKYYIDDGVLPGHLDMQAVPGIESSAGSLGHGLSIGLGMALANRMDNNKGHIYVLLGDGECNEGSVWEAIMLASTLTVTNLTAIIDYNKLQSLGRTNEIIDQKNIAKRWEAFGWDVCEVDGHNLDELESVFKAKVNGPKVVIAHTVKGKGISFMENKLEWHYKSPNSQQYSSALEELRGK
ncbi:transketolase [Lysinibacillus louembei]|uniref:Transketolase n=1 Tax=Lysinibacillus louembei TaxID=1470088 RepID=A0ABZ0RZT4_9BACI|nr:transketolase [Lysinibacillus louembei]WPK12395.1 transketolase [Lysinibacillus louembei]